LAVAFLVLLLSLTTGVGHPVESLPDVRSADAVCADNRRPDGVTFHFQVCRNKVDPCKRIRNLLAKYESRLAMGDEVEPRGP
jgi:hypothetical protein